MIRAQAASLVTPLRLRTSGISSDKSSEKKGHFMAGDQDVLTVKELCELLRLHPSTVYKLIRQNKIPRFRVGNEWRFRRDVIERWMTEESMNAQQLRKGIQRGVNGEARQRRGRS
jgi:excisionase family DNA binding protein